MDGLFQAIGLRTSGAYIISLSELAPGLLVSYLIVSKYYEVEERYRKTVEGARQTGISSSTI